MKEWNKIKPGDVEGNVFSMIGKENMLISSGTLSAWNTMTAAWGGFGFLWQKNVVFAFVRPTRHTYGFMEKNPNFSLSFFPESEREKLLFCGSHSGRDVDKAEATGLRPVDAGNHTIAFEQARLVIVCRKIYHQDIDPENFLDPAIDEHYPEKDYHRVYVGEVLSVLKD